MRIIVLWLGGGNTIRISDKNDFFFFTDKLGFGFNIFRITRGILSINGHELLYISHGVFFFFIIIPSSRTYSAR